MIYIKYMYIQSFPFILSIILSSMLQVLSSHEVWEQHVTMKHGLSAEDAHNGLLILEEAHMVLQIPNPTRLDSLVDMIKRGEAVTETVGDGGPSRETV
jgi:cell division inhibitor SulA